MSVEIPFYKEDTKEVLVWKKTTWGNFGQHSNIYTFVITPQLEAKAIFEVLPQLRHVNNDSRKNYYRYTYAQINDILKLDGCILKIVDDYASSSKREVKTQYYMINSGNIIELKSQSGLRDTVSFYDLVELPSGQKLKVRKDKVEVAQ